MLHRLDEMFVLDRCSIETKRGELQRVVQHFEDFGELEAGEPGMVSIAKIGWKNLTQ